MQVAHHHLSRELDFLMHASMPGHMPGLVVPRSCLKPRVHMESIATDHWIRINLAPLSYAYEE